MTSITNETQNYFKLELLVARSNDLLRRLFKSRYSLFNSGQPWNDTPACGTNYFTTAVSKNKKISLTAVQKTSVSNGNTNEWDLGLLTALLINVDRPTTLNTTQIEQLDQEDAMLKQLKNIRNDLAHHASKSVSDAEFNQFWTDLSTILVALGDDSSELDKLKDDDDVFGMRTQSINEENVEEAKRWNSLGTQAHKEGKFAEAIALFTRATVLADVADHDRAIFFSNMAASRLSLYEREQGSGHLNRLEIDGVSDERYRALQDAKKARNLCLTWWKGHFRVGKVYAALNEHEKTINSFERALALAPTNNEIQKALDDSREVLSRQLRYDHLDPRGRPRTMPEQLNELKEKLGIDPEKVRTVHSLLEKLDPAGADVVKGHKYTHGDVDVKQDYEQAARYFAKAASQGNAEGMYNLAFVTDRGFGVKKDHNIALKLLEQAAEQSPEHPKFKTIRNIGVAEAQHALGLRYAEGIVVHKNLSIAAHWYQRAADHGSAESANNLALMYEDGVGVEKNWDKAQQLFELSGRRGDPNAMQSLANLLLKQNDFQMAKIWYDRACEAGNIIAQANRDTFETMLQREQQLVDQCSPDALKLIKALKATLHSIGGSQTVHTQSGQQCAYDYNILTEYANRGSITARRMCSALEHFFKALSILIQTETLGEKEENIFVQELSECYRLEYIVAQMPGVEMRHRVDQIVDRVLQRCNNALTSSSSQMDEDVRICYVVLHMDSRESIAQFLGICKQKYPKSIYFFDLSSAVNGCLERYEAALFEANSGLQLDPNYCELLYLKAVALRLIGKDMNEAIDAYRRFLSIAPKDHRKIPESYYAMAACYLMRDRTKSVTDIIRQTYNQGEEAEIIQLPCFLPYKSTSKTLLKPVLDVKSLLSAETNPVIDHKLRLENPHRIEVITHHREWESTTLLPNMNSKLTLYSSSHKPRFKQQTSKSLIGLKPITLRDMNPTKDHVYNGFVLSVTIIEEAYSWASSIHLIIEDEHLDCERMHIYNFPEGQAEYLTNKMFTIGSKVDIINPYLRIGAGDRKSLIRVDDFSSIIMRSESKRVVNMCRCCGVANAPHLCSKCKQARYCSKECQKMDWQLYKHKLVCNSE